MMAFRGCMAVLLGIAFTLDGISTCLSYDYNDKKSCFFEIVLMLLAIYQLFVLYNSNNIIAIGFSTGIVFICAVYLVLHGFWCRYSIDKSRHQTNAYHLKAKNTMLKSQVKMLQNEIKGLVHKQVLNPKKYGK